MLYDIEYQYLDSLNDGWRHANIVIYDSSAVGEGETIDYALMRRGFVERYNGVRRASFRINYYHPALPPAVKNNKPNDVVDVIHIDQPKEEKKPEKEEAEIKKPKEIVKTEEPEHQIEPQIEIKKDGEKIQLSITLNINIK